MSTRLLVDAPEFWAAFQADAQAARESVYAQTLSFEGDSAGWGLANLMMSLDGGIDRRIVVDEYTKYILNDTFVYSPKALRSSFHRTELKETRKMMDSLEQAGVGLKWVNPLHPLLFYRFSARNHKKILSIDDRVAYIGGINFSDHNFEWHDLMVRFDDPRLVEFLRNDLRATWEGKNQGGQFEFDDVEILLLDGKSSEKTCERVLEILNGARKSIFVESPYFSFPFFEPLQRATQRGVEVTLLAPEANNWPLYDEYTRYEAQKSGIRLRHYPGRMNHLKAILVDESKLLVGSSNFDYFSFTLHQEIIAILSDARVISDFIHRVRDPDLRAARSPSSGVSLARGERAQKRVQRLFKSLAFLNRTLG